MEKPVTIDMTDFGPYSACFHQALDCLKRIERIDPEVEHKRASLEALASAIWSMFDTIEINATEQRYIDLAKSVDALADLMASFASDGGEDDELSFAAVNLMRLSATGLCRRAAEVAEMGNPMSDLHQGAQGLIDLIDTIQGISDETCNLLPDPANDGLGPDTRDYQAMANTIAETFAHYLGQPPDSTVYQGFLRALTDLIAITVDGCGIPRQGWDPIQTTEFAFSGERAKALQILAGSPAPEASTFTFNLVVTRARADDQACVQLKGASTATEAG